jgi:hypothetical protein
MQKYKDWAPTQFDRAGAFLDERDDWFVAPVIQTRDSGALERSNFAVFLNLIGGESETIEIHKFGHWGPGWFEIILISPENKEAVKAGNEISEKVQDYPILDEDDFSEREFEDACEYWENMSLRDRIYYCDRAGLSIFAARSEYIPEEMDIYVLLKNN